MKKYGYYFTLILIVVSLSLASSAQDKDIAYYAAKTPFKMSVPTVPHFADKTFSIPDYGAVSDGKTLCTTAFAKAIDACTNAGGGKVLVPAGNWLTGPIELKSNVNLHLEKGANIQFTTDHTQYPMIIAGGKNNVVPESPLYAYNATNIAITGQGVIDGAGDSWRPVKKNKVPGTEWSGIIRSGIVSPDGKIWWPSADAMNGEQYVNRLKNNPDATLNDYLPARDYLRPYMLYLIHCDAILIEGVTLRNSPKFVFYPNHCTNLTMDGVTVYNDWWAQNGDGIDISACKNVAIYKCIVNAGDDGICMKSSGNGTEDHAELENILIAGCTVLRAHGGFVIGSNTDGGMRNIYVTDCNYIGTDVGIRVKSNPGRGGLVKDIYIDNITMSNIQNEAILFATSYEDVPAGKSSKGVSTTESGKIPEFRDFYISNIKCKGASTAISITGLPDKPVSKIHFNNINITSDQGFTATDATDVDMNNVDLAAGEPLYSTHRCKDITLDGKSVE